MRVANYACVGCEFFESLEQVSRLIFTQRNKSVHKIVKKLIKRKSDVVILPEKSSAASMIDIGIEKHHKPENLSCDTVCNLARYLMDINALGD